MKKLGFIVLSLLAAVAIQRAAQASSEDREITEAGMACTTLSSAVLQESLRVKKDATSYEIASVTNVSGCIMVTQIGRRVSVWSHNYADGSTFLEVIPDGKFQRFWIPARMVE